MGWQSRSTLNKTSTQMLKDKLDHKRLTLCLNKKKKKTKKKKKKKILSTFYLFPEVVFFFSCNEMNKACCCVHPVIPRTPAFFSPYETKHYRGVLMAFFLKKKKNANRSLGGSRPTPTCELFSPDMCFCFSCLTTSYNL